MESRRSFRRSTMGGLASTLALIVAHTAAAQTAAPPADGQVQPTDATDPAAQITAPAADANAAAAPQDSGAGVGDIVVTAQRRSESIQKVPISIQAISGDQLLDQGIHNSADISRIAANVGSQQPAGEGSITILTIRGIGLNDYSTTNSGPNGLYFDEVYLSSAIAQTFPLFDLDRVEVLKGPQGTLYGRNTSGGAINYVTRKPTNAFEGYLNTQFGSFNTLNVQGAVGGPITSDLSVRIAVNVNESSGYANNVTTGQKENGTNSVAGRAQLAWKPTDRLSIALSGNFYRLDTRPNRFRHLGVLDPQTGQVCSVATARAGDCVDLYGLGTLPGFYDVSSTMRNHMLTRIYGGSARVDYDLGGVTLTSISSYIHADRNYLEDTDAVAPRLVEVGYNTRSNTLTQELRVNLDRGPLKAVAGVYYLNETLHQDTSIDLLRDIDLFYGPGVGDNLAETSFAYATQKSYSYAVFGQFDYKILPALTLTLGGRYSWEKKRLVYDRTSQYQVGEIDVLGPVIVTPTIRERIDDGAVNYRVALNYQVAPTVSLYASTATGYKSGGFNGGFLDNDPAVARRQAQPVRPEHVTSYEIGLKSTWLDRKILFNIAAFYNRYKDQQVFTLIPALNAGDPPINVLDNAPKSHTEGIEATLGISPVRGLTITENLGLLRTRLDQYSVVLAQGAPDYSGNRLPLAPEVSSSTVVQYGFDVPGGKVSLLGGADYKSKVFFDTANQPLITQPGYWLFNARAAYRYNLPRGAIEFAVFGRNLADKKYLVGSSDLSGFFGLVTDNPGRPREIGAEINFTF